MGAATAWRSRYLLTGFLAVAAHGEAAAEPDLALVRTPGGYVLLLDAENRPIAGNYWLSADLKVRMQSRNAGSYPEPLLYTDRDFQRSRFANMYLFINAKETVTPDLGAVPIGETVTVTMRREQIGRLAAQVEPKTVTYSFTMVGLISETMAGAKLLSRIYEITPSDPANKDMDWGRRIYIETLDLDISREQAARVANIETGKAGSTGDFEGIYASRVLSGDDYAGCMAEKRAGREYQDAVRREHETNDGWMTGEFLATDVPWWERDDTQDHMTALLDVTGLCLPGAAAK